MKIIYIVDRTRKTRKHTHYTKYTILLHESKHKSKSYNVNFSFRLQYMIVLECTMKIPKTHEGTGYIRNQSGMTFANIPFQISKKKLKIMRKIFRVQSLQKNEAQDKYHTQINTQQNFIKTHKFYYNTIPLTSTIIMIPVQVILQYDPSKLMPFLKYMLISINLHFKVL